MNLAKFISDLSIIKSFANVNEGIGLCLSEAPEKNEIRQFL